jgi:hypothetical protein
MFTWALLDALGTETGTTEAFASQTDAEAWFGTNWEALAQGGTAEVTLRDTDDGSEVYTMSLAAE